MHVGLVQSSEVMLNFGLDKNTNANPGSLHYVLGLGGVWTSSTIEGTVMVRPVFRSGMEGVWLSEAPVVAEASELRVHPNPTTSGWLTVDWPSAGPWTLYDMSGRRCASGTAAHGGVQGLDISAVQATGLYILHHHASGQATRIQWQK